MVSTYLYNFYTQIAPNIIILRFPFKQIGDRSGEGTNLSNNSFILFGNGDRITLRDIQNTCFLTNVDLMVLSSCETGLGGTLGNGEEILGFGNLMQNAGARAAIASVPEF
ncbi:hypothetical protein A6770_03700 [Nostoc minutum NIES-26]|uniref:CHAT domain-containing protein n=1 Tax=Nostoc minutum NIES-26 TaxID=1844469 RepID=A0A367QLW2_9NOSO|nr:hypothetical protein A6770_03700 [Nostoc minutum NIES-26]